MNKPEKQNNNFRPAADHIKPKRIVKCTLKIDDRSYRLASDGSVKELKTIGAIVNKKIDKLKANDMYMDKSKLYLTTALELAEDYVRLLQDYRELQSENAEMRKILAQNQKVNDD